MACWPCTPCTPDENGECTPCTPCSPDSGGPCFPCTPCSPDNGERTTSCWPCSPCSPDEGVLKVHCIPCSPCGPDSSSGSSSSGGGCFLTSACVESHALPDDCFELQTLRAFRDRMVAKSGEFRELVADYYSCAPKIVRAINAAPDSSRHWRRLYDDLVVPCVRLICSGCEKEAWKLYRGVVEELRSKWTPQ